jgi:hypothetical protein
MVPRPPQFCFAPQGGTSQNSHDPCRFAKQNETQGAADAGVFPLRQGLRRDRSLRFEGLHYIYRGGKGSFCNKKTPSFAKGYGGQAKGLDADFAGYAVFLFSH